MPPLCQKTRQKLEVIPPKSHDGQHTLYPEIGAAYGHGYGFDTKPDWTIKKSNTQICQQVFVYLMSNQ
ncbi:hypothetical protein DPMN_008875 [Dreissena polymorpha]|uniref:Uncharacterized protein n=1 Tax=Dreissena polymorpha TaxID=45954 RepID=A0A9D4N065_DREPO|nr:hypothetical protein DPMN_008875 [Dreissena polymorpha]